MAITFEQRRKYSSRNREKYKTDPVHRRRVLDSNKKWRLNNLEKSKAIIKAYRDAHPEMVEEQRLKFKFKNIAAADVAIEHNRHGKKWTAEDEIDVQMMHEQGRSYEYIANVMKRSIKSIDNRIQKFAKEAKNEK